MLIKPKSDKPSIVLIGSFSPAVFSPAWLVLQGLVGKDRLDNSLVNIVHHDFSQFSIAGMQFDIQLNRFVVTCDAMNRDIIRDLVLSIFQDHLPSTPIKKLGINRQLVFPCPSEKVRDKFGSMLVPKEPWGAWGQDIDDARTTKGHGGMVGCTMRQIPRPDGLEGYIQAQISPILNESTLVSVEINNHFEIAEVDDISGVDRAMEILTDRWSEALDAAEYIIDGLMQTVKGIE